MLAATTVQKKRFMDIVICAMTEERGDLELVLVYLWQKSNPGINELNRRQSSQYGITQTVGVCLPANY